MTGLLCSPEEASCLIPNLIAELETPCPCEGLEGLVLRGLGYKGQRVTIRVRPGVLEVDGVPADELEALRERRCPVCRTGTVNSPSSARQKTW